MNSSFINRLSRFDSQRIAWLGIAGLLILRLPLLTGAPFFWKETPRWVEPVYQIGTYLLIALLVWWERDRLETSHVDKLVLVLLILFKPLSTLIPVIWKLDLPLSFPHPLSFCLWCVAAGLGFILWKNRSGMPRFQTKPLIGFCVGGIVGITASLVISLLMIAFHAAPVPSAPGLMALWSPLSQLGYAAVDEEPLFRGFLWGALRRRNWKDGWICLFQAALFTLAHSYFLKAPNGLLNLAIIFIVATLSGVLVWRSRTIATSMAFHAFWNGSAIFIYPILSLVFK